MQKALMEMNVQLHYVVSDITGITGMKIILRRPADSRLAVNLLDRLVWLEQLVDGGLPRLRELPLFH